MYIQKRALGIPTKEASINRNRHTDTTTALYISTKEPYVYQKKSGMHIHKRALCISTKEPYVYPEKKLP